MLEITQQSWRSGPAYRTQVGEISYSRSMAGAPEPLPEPWLRGPILGVHPLLAPVLYTFQHAREDLVKHTGPLRDAQVWATPHGFGSVGFHIRHIAGSTDRLMTYLQGRSLDSAQRAALQAENRPTGANRDELLAEMDRVFRQAEAVVRSLDPAILPEPRWVGRQRLATTVSGLLTHIAEHIQRHVGQAISAAKLAQITR
jgi:uncharacterized damage-inducible protein DinB